MSAELTAFGAEQPEPLKKYYKQIKEWQYKSYDGSTCISESSAGELTIQFDSENGVVKIGSNG